MLVEYSMSMLMEYITSMLMEPLTSMLVKHLTSMLVECPMNMLTRFSTARQGENFYYYKSNIFLKQNSVRIRIFPGPHVFRVEHRNA